MKIAVIGAGSIGSRHARILRDQGHCVVVVSNRTDAGDYRTIHDALQQHRIDYVVIASKTSQHNSDLQALASANFAGKVLVEKPLFASAKSLPANNFQLAAVGYNLRFHPAIQWLEKVLPRLGRLSSAHFYVGQYLSTWRQSIDYRASSSSNQESGGGVLRDLSHEIDLAHLLFGNWTQLTASGGRFSNLEITSDDTFSILLQMKNCPVVSIHLNYLDRLTQRNLTINGDDGTIHIDLISGSARHNNARREFNIQPDGTYVAENKAMISGTGDGLCSLAEGLTVVQTIEAIENASLTRTWISQ